MRNIRIYIGVAIIGMLLFWGVIPAISQSYMKRLNNFEKSTLAFIGKKNTPDKYYRVPSYLEMGDLAFFDSPAPPGRWNVRGYDHVAIYIGDNKFIGSTRNDVKHVLEVNISDYNFFMNVIHYKNPMFARVISATPSQRYNATQWALSRIGDPYQTWDPRKEANPDAPIITASRWYCSEIVWAAYYHQGIDIDKNGWNRDFPWFFPLWSAVSPQDIAEDNDIVHLS
jgi:hypothetical protein